MRVPLFRPRLSAKSRAYLETALENGHWASGPHVQVFENELARYTGYDEVIAVSSGTMAARLIWLALAKESRVLIGPSLAFASPYLEACLEHYWPHFSDIDADTWCLDTSEFPARLPFTKRVVLAVDYGGWPCETPKTDGVLWVRDAAHRVARDMASEGAPIAFFSFHPTKPIGGLGGGAIALAGEYVHLEANLRRLRDFGRTKNGSAYDIGQWGTNAYIQNVSAAVALGALEELEQTTAARWEIAGQYERDLPTAFQQRILNAACSYHLYPVLLPRGADRDPFVEFMGKLGVEVGIHYPPVHRLKVFALSRITLPVTENIGARIVSLPCWAGMSSEQVEFVCDSATEFLQSRSGV